MKTFLKNGDRRFQTNKILRKFVSSKSKINRTFMQKRNTPRWTLKDAGKNQEQHNV